MNSNKIECLNEISMETVNSDKTIFIVRHGESYYRQTQTSIDIADDLTAKGIESSRKIADWIKSESYAKRLKVLSSPYGRALQTAKVIVDTLDQCPKVDAIETTSSIEETRVYRDLIESNERLVKSQGFRWEYVNPLIAGGTFDFDGTSMTIDSGLTNPAQYDFHTYLVQDEMKKIPDGAKRSWPKEYANYVQGIETFESVSRRMLQAVADVLQRDETDINYLIVTHGSLMGFLSFLHSGQFKEEIKTSEVITLRNHNGETHVTRAGSLPKLGNMSNSDIFEAFNQRFGNGINL